MSEKPKVILDLEKELNVRIEDFVLNKNGEITSLDLSSTKIKNIEPLYKLTNHLSTLDLSSNKIKDIIFLKKFVNLNSLRLDENFISDLSPLSSLTKLSSLDLRGNIISDLSPLSSLINLGSLDLGENVISDLGPLSELVNLLILELNENEISNLTPLSRLHKLLILDLGENQISDLKLISGLENLISLQLSHNQISDLYSLSSLANVLHIDLSFNKISNINNVKFICQNLKVKDVLYEKRPLENGLNLYENPLEQEIIDVIQSGGKNALLKYLEAKERGTAKIPEAKMVLLGEPRAGKTTLQKYLMGLPINEKEESTPDIQISAWKPFVADEVDEFCKNIKINLWDFGGQEIQYSLHKLFMTEDTLYVIVLDSTKDQSPLQYLKFLENYAPNSPFIIINNYGDVATSNTFKIDENYLRENYNGKNGMPFLKAIFNRVSVLQASKLEPSYRKIMDDVEGTIKKELLNLKNLNKEFPKEYQLVKTAIEAEYSKPDKHFITMSYYRELCKSLNITDDEGLRIAILEYLNEIGVLRYFKDSPITDRHILNPQWLIDGAYSIIIDPLTAENHGVLTKKEAYSILKKSKKSFRFEEDEAEFIFKTMKFYGLLHADETDKKLYIPLRFNSLQPTALIDFYEKGKHFYFEFKTDIPEEIISNLIVKHFEEITNHHYWSKGAIFTENDVRILVKIEDRNIDFYIQGKFHQSYFEALRRTLRKSLERLRGLSYTEMVEFEHKGKIIKAKYEDLVTVIKDNWGDYRDYTNKTKIDERELIQILGGYFSTPQIDQITNVTNNFYGDFNDNRFQQITIIHELNALLQSAKNIEDKKALEQIKSEIQLLNKTNSQEEKKSLGKRLFDKIKQLSTDSLDDVVKDKLKELFPKIIENGIDYIEKADFDGIMQIFGGIL